MTEWFEDESFWIDCYPFLFSRQRFDAAAGEVASLLGLVPYAGDSVLDLCCGPARHAVELAGRGLRVTAVDRSEFLLEAGRRRAVEAGVEIEWIASDMRDYRRVEAYDLIINLFTSFGYFEDPADDERVLRNMYENLRSGGSVVIEVIGKEWLAQGFESTGSDRLADGSLLVRRHEIFNDWTQIRNEWIVIRDGKSRTFRFDQRIYSGQELKDRLARAGFATVRLYGSLDGADYGPGADRLVAVARK